MPITKGQFITLEGIDGAGKSTQAEWLKIWLTERNIPHYFTREPGGTPLSETLRDLLLHHSMDIETETLLMFSARAAHINTVILPKLEAGVWVISDRFTDATYAYQGGGRGVAWERIAVLEAWVQQDLQPNLTLLFDIPESVSAERLRNARTPDRFEQEQLDFFRRVREAYLKRLKECPERIVYLNAATELSAIQRQLSEIIKAHCLKHEVG